MTGIPGLGGHNAQLPRALTDLMDKALAEEALPAPRGGASSPAKGPSAPGEKAVPAPRGEAVLVDLSDDAVELLGRTAEEPASPAEESPGRDIVTPRQDVVTPRRDVVTPRQVPLAQLVAVLKRSGTDFRQAVRILANVELDQPLPSRATLRAMWEEPASRDEPAPTAGTASTRSTGSAPHRTDEDAVYDASLDRLVRDRAWHRAAPEPTEDAQAPTLRTVGDPRPANQVYVAGLTTTEYQRLVVLLGEEMPEWFAEVRGSRGLRALMERRGIARLNVARFAGLRLGGWALAAAGIAIAWIVGIRTGAWW